MNAFGRARRNLSRAQSREPCRQKPEKIGALAPEGESLFPSLVIYDAWPMRLGLLGMIVVPLGVLGALAQSPEIPLPRRVLVVYNSSARQSQQVAQYYMRKR